MANLTQLKMLEDLNGFLLVDKPVGIAFSTVVKTVKRKFNLVKVGHGGSLDAMASGLMVILINDANKYVDEIMGADRAYAGVMRLGCATDTHDVHGRETSRRDVPVNVDFEAALRECRGDVFQTEPPFCSVRKEGSADYEIAETGEHKPFLAHVYRFALAPMAEGEDPTRRAFELLASKGVLVRTLVNDFGAALGCGACLESLRRTRVWRFGVEEAIPFEELLRTDIGDFAARVISLREALSRR